MAKLARPIDSDTKYYQPKPMEAGFYRFLVKDSLEWGSNKDAGVKGAYEKLSKLEQEQVNVMSIRWTLSCLDAPYEGFNRNLWTTYWASKEKLAGVLDGKIKKYLKNNPTVEEEEAKKTVEPWRPQESLFDIFFACNLMVKDEERGLYKPLGWKFEDGTEEPRIACINTVIWGKIGPTQGTDRTDDLQSVAPFHEE